MKAIGVSYYFIDARIKPNPGVKKKVLKYK